ncbi:MAG: GNAT family N-acetyltransferase [Bacteroidota bacterium]
MRIRPCRSEDAVALSSLFYRSVKHLGVRKYSDEQVEAWASQTPTPGRMHRMGHDGRLRLVAIVRQQIVVYCDLEQDGHIDHLYAAPEVAGQGYASHLYETLEAEALQLGIKKLVTEASEVAKPFFERKGFDVQQRRELQLGGVAIHNYAMTKAL